MIEFTFSVAGDISKDVKPYNAVHLVDGDLFILIDGYNVLHERNTPLIELAINMQVWLLSPINLRKEGIVFFPDGSEEPIFELFYYDGNYRIRFGQCDEYSKNISLNDLSKSFIKFHYDLNNYLKKYLYFSLENVFSYLDFNV